MGNPLRREETAPAPQFESYSFLTNLGGHGAVDVFLGEDTVGFFVSVTPKLDTRLHHGTRAVLIQLESIVPAARGGRVSSAVVGATGRGTESAVVDASLPAPTPVVL